MAYKIHPELALKVGRYLWPKTPLYDKQEQIVWSTLTNKETYVPAGNKLGKDFIAGYLATVCFVICQAKGITCRIVTTSVAEHHLKVRWGEIGRFISTSSQPLVGKADDQLTVNHQEIRRSSEAAAKNPLNYLVARVSEKGEGLAGHHAEFTLILSLIHISE